MSPVIEVQRPEVKVTRLRQKMYNNFRTRGHINVILYGFGSMSGPSAHTTLACTDKLQVSKEYQVDKLEMSDKERLAENE